MPKPLLTLAAIAAAAVPAVAQPAVAPPPVPARFLGVWGREGRCDLPAARLRITARRAGWGDGPMKPIVWSAEDRRLRWDSEYDAAFFETGGSPDILVYAKEGADMPAGREGYARCTAGRARLPWPRP